MQKLVLTSVLALSGLLAACSSTVDLDAPRTASSGSSSSMFAQSEYRCNADPAQKLTGQTHSEAVEQEAKELSSSRIVRTLRPGQVITMEYNPERLNLRLDKQNVIATIGCG